MRLPWAKDWSAVEQALPVEVETTALERIAGPGDGFPVQPAGSLATPPNISTIKHAWSEPPRRGLGDLLAAYILSPPLRSVVELVADSWSIVRWFTGDPGDLANRNFKHPGIRLFHNMNPRLIGMEGRKLLQVHMLTAGEFIAVIAPSLDPVKRFDIYPVPPNVVTLEDFGNGVEYIVRMGSGDWRFPASQILHFRAADPLNVYGRGRGPGWALGDEIEAYEYQSKHVKAYYYNSTAPEMFIIAEDAKPEQLRDWQEQFDEQHRGFRKHWRPAWFNKKISVIELTRVLGEERVEELRKSWFDIARYVYHVPPEITGNSEDSNRATVKESSQHMGLYVTLPKCISFQEWWQVVVMDRLYDGAELNFISPVPREFDRRDQIMEKHPESFTRNEVRTAAGFSTVSDGEKYPVPMNIEMHDARRTLREARGDAKIRLVLTDQTAAAE